MFLLFQMGLSLFRAAVVWAILDSISGFDPSSEIIEPIQGADDKLGQTFQITKKCRHVLKNQLIDLKLGSHVYEYIFCMI